MRKEVERILAAIPADQLAIQWDARYEFAMLEGAIAVWFEDVRAGVVERLLRLARMVPSAVELGFHLCYGDDEHGHFAEPADAGKLVGVANALAATLDRPLNWIHMPVPHDRDDDAYYAPLGDLRLPLETELYLGLIHAGDDGAPRRIAAARQHVEHFGIATECGWGRGGAAAVSGLLELHRELSAPLPNGPARRRARARSRGRTASCACPTRTGPTATSTRRASPTTTSTPTAGTATSTSPSRTSCARCATATSCSTTPAAPASCSTACACACSTAASAW